MGQRILIVEDEPNIVESLSFLLEREGYDIDVETQGDKAAARIQSLTPDLVILDAMLPGRSGFDILRDIVAGGEARQRVMMLTAKGQTKDRKIAEEIGVDLFMTKPFANSEIVEAVAGLLSQA